MASETSGATAVGVFILADDFLAAAEQAHAGRRMHSSGPVRLLCYHACELYLKAFLRAHGADLDELRGHGHDLAELLRLAEPQGLDCREIKGGIEKAAEAKEYVRVRYMVVDDRFIAPVDKVLRLARNTREAVRLALRYNEHGMPADPTPER
jgi:HEPN domain-containing protein